MLRSHTLHACGCARARARRIDESMSVQPGRKRQNGILLPAKAVRDFSPKAMVGHHSSALAQWKLWTAGIAAAWFVACSQIGSALEPPTASLASTIGTPDAWKVSVLGHGFSAPQGVAVLLKRVIPGAPPSWRA